MNPSPHEFDPQALLDQEAFIRGLARSLVVGGGLLEVDDVLQTVWLRALQSPPKHAGALRSWVGRVVRGFVVDQHRASRARTRREQAVSRPERLPSTEDTLAREAIRTKVVEGVLELPEIYRHALVLRYFEGLAPREIGRRLGVPASTVRTRLSRGLELLRGSLDRSHEGDRRSWSLAIVPLAAPKAVSTGILTSGLWSGWLVEHKVAVLVAFAVLFTVGALWLPRGDAAGSGDSIPARFVASADPDPGGGAVSIGTETPGVERRVALSPVSRPQVRVVHADGSAADGLLYWIDEVTPWPAADKVLNRKWNTIPEGARRTRDRGVLRAVAPERSGLLWVAVSKVVRVAFQLPAKESVLRLPKLAPLTVRCAGVEEGDRWRMLIRPAMFGRFEPPAGSSRPQVADWLVGRQLVRRVSSTQEGPDTASFFLVREQVVEGRGPLPVVCPLVAGTSWMVDLVGRRFCADPSVRDGIWMVPTDLVVASIGPKPLLEVEVLEPDGARSSIGGELYIRVSRGRHVSLRIEAGYADLGRFAHDRWGRGEAGKHRVVVLMDDGELFERSVGFGVRRDRKLELRRGSGREPRLLTTAGPRFTDQDRFLIESVDGSRSSCLTVGADALNQAAPGSCVISADGRKLHVHLREEESTRRVWVLQRTGQVGFADVEWPPAAAPAVPPTLSHPVRWLPTRSLSTMRLAALDAKLGTEGNLCVRLEVELPRRDGGREWQAVDSFLRFLAPTPWTDNGTEWVDWNKVVPDGWRHRLRVWSLNHGWQTVEGDR